MKVVIAFRMPRRGIEILRSAGFEVEVFSDRRAPRSWILEHIEDADALVVSPIVPVDREIVERGKRLRIVALFGSGYENIDIDACNSRGVCVARVADYIDEAAAELALALALAHLRRVVQGDRVVRAGEWRGFVPRELLGRSIRSVVVGIVGLGKLGTHVAKLFRALGARVVYWSRRRKPLVELALGIEYAPLDTVLRESDVVVLCVAGSRETERLIDREKLRLLKDGALLINVSRGVVVDEEALIEELRSGRIYAALDVYREEPLPPNHELTRLSNTILTPHIGGYTLEAMVSTAIDVAEMVVKYLRDGVLEKGEPLNEACRTR